MVKMGLTVLTVLMVQMPPRLHVWHATPTALETPLGMPMQCLFMPPAVLKGLATGEMIQTIQILWHKDAAGVTPMKGLSTMHKVDYWQCPL
jgi:hypothetical protein